MRSSHPGSSSPETSSPEPAGSPSTPSPLQSAQTPPQNDVLSTHPPPRPRRTPSTTTLLSPAAFPRGLEQSSPAEGASAQPARTSATREHRLPHGGFELIAPSNGVLVLRTWGHFDMELSERAVAMVEPRLSMTSRCFTLFLDLNELDSYDTPARVRLTAWLQSLRQRTDAIHVSTRSRLVSMGVAVANLALEGALLRYGPDNRARYDAALQQATHRKSA